MEETSEKQLILDKITWGKIQGGRFQIKNIEEVRLVQANFAHVCVLCTKVNLPEGPFQK